MDGFLTIHEVAEKLKYSRATIERYIADGNFPACYQIGRRGIRMWNPKDISEYIKKSKRAA